MKLKRIIALVWLTSSVTAVHPSNRQGISLSWFGFSQITAEAGSGVAALGDRRDDGLRFGADRIRLGFRARWGRAYTKVQVDFNRKDISRVTAGMPEIIKDAEVGYAVSDVASVKTGIFKTPVGMDFNVSGSKLDITKRGLEKPLVLERALGAMISGRNVIGRLGYDLGIFNPATRGEAVSGGTAGLQYAYAVRCLYDVTGSFHVEASYGLNREGGGDETRDYTVWDAAVSYRAGAATLKGEWIRGHNVQGIDGFDQQVWYVHAGYRLTSRFEPVLRHYQGKAGSGGLRLGNTFIGINIFLNPEEPRVARIQINFVAVSRPGDEWPGLEGYTGNAFLAQFQFAF